MINVTNRAAEQLRALVGSSAERGLRIGVSKGGCSGMHYEMSLGEQRPGDVVVEDAGVKLLVDAESAALLRGATLDYNDSLTGAGFQIVNPNAARTCGCGSSFEPTRSA
jgi:Iron-sulfur cluster assembly accessory protein